MIMDGTLDRKPHWVEVTRTRWNHLGKKKWFPSINSVSRTVTLILIGLTLWGIAFCLFEEHVGVESQMFKLVTMFVLSYVAGRVIGFIKLPPLLGMLLMGILLRNVGFIHLTGGYVEFAAFLRETALACILIRAGLGLDFDALKRLSLMVLRLSFIPCITEAIVTALVSHYLLSLPWLYAILLGVLLGAVSPAVVIPCLFALQEKGYGTDKGIPTLIVAAASFDDVISVSAFGVVLSMIFSTSGSLAMQILNGPIGVLIGIVFGVVWGLIGWTIPHKNDNFVIVHRCILVAAGGIFSIVASNYIGYQGAGPLACIIAPFVACMGWKKEGWDYDKNPVRINFAVLWTFFEPIIFSLIGSEVNLGVLDGNVVGYSIATLLIALAARILITVVVAFGGGFSWKEKVFIAWAWFPKATVQAALGPVALDMARLINSEEDEGYADKLLVTAVLSIILTAPTGAILITTLGPICLPKSEKKPVEHEETQLKETVNGTSAEERIEENV